MMDQVTPSGRSFVLIHFAYPTSDASPPEFRVACMPNMTEFHSTPYHQQVARTNAHQAVTCPACKRTDVYRRAKAR